MAIQLSNKKAQTLAELDEKLTKMKQLDDSLTSIRSAHLCDLELIRLRAKKAEVENRYKHELEEYQRNIAKITKEITELETAKESASLMSEGHILQQKSTISDEVRKLREMLARIDHVSASLLKEAELERQVRTIQGQMESLRREKEYHERCRKYILDHQLEKDTLLMTREELILVAHRHANLELVKKHGPYTIEINHDYDWQYNTQCEWTYGNETCNCGVYKCFWKVSDRDLLEKFTLDSTKRIGKAVPSFEMDNSDSD